MNESMGISQIWELKLEEVKFDGEPNPDCDQVSVFDDTPDLDELLSKPFKHINDVKKCFEACNSKTDVLRVLKMVPRMFGEFTVEFDDTYEEFTIVNTYYDDDFGDVEEEYCYDYSDDWDFDNEWDFNEEDN
jgi:hypothetical protein